MSPRFSFIIPIYNVAPYLRECMDSVLEQTFTGWEAICVDDGSIDQSLAILNEYATRDKRIKVIHQANGGLSEARNTALSCVQGDWVIYLDGDDIFNAYGLEELSRNIECHPECDLIRFRIRKFDDGTKCDWGDVTHSLSATIDISKEISMQVSSLGLCEFAYQSKAFGKYRFEGRAFHEDRLYFAEVLSSASSILDTQLPLYGYRMRKGSITHSPNRVLEETRRALTVFPKILETYVMSGKHVDRRTFRYYGLYWVERIPYQISLQSSDVRHELLSEYFASLHRNIPLQGWPMFVRIIERLFPIWACVWVLSVLPYTIKLKGLHR